MKHETNEPVNRTSEESKNMAFDSIGNSEMKTNELDMEQNAASLIRSEELLHGKSRVMIQHGDHVYILLCTKNNRLILIK